MPSLKPSRPCTTPMCPNFATKGWKCDLHAKQVQAKYDKIRGNSYERGYDRQWIKVREIKLSINPLCEKCVVETPAVLVHHIVPVADNPNLKLVLDNLQSLCVACHEKIHGNRFFK